MNRAYHDAVMINRHFADLNPIIVGQEKCSPEHSFGPAVRKYTLIHYIVSGKGYIFKNGSTYTATAGEAFIINPYEVVTYTADKHEPWVYQWVGFDGKLAEKFASLPTVIPFPVGLLQEMLDAANAELSEYRLASLLFRMYAELFEGKKSSHHYVRRVQDHIRALYMKPLKVESIAAEINLDRRYLTRIFKQKTGQTIQEYLISVRMDEAQRCLIQGFSVDESAKMCGYEDTCNFSKMFKRHFGVSPQTWKKEREQMDR